jgi:hypothetical protein
MMKMNPFWSTYRQAMMIGVNAIIGSQKLLLAQAKWLLAQARSGEAWRHDAMHRAEPLARPALAAAQAADEHRLEQPPRGSARPARRRAEKRGASRRRS